MAGALHRQQQDNAALLATLENRVLERTQTLEAAQAQLKEANAGLEHQTRELRSEMDRREHAEEALRQTGGDLAQAILLLQKKKP